MFLGCNVQGTSKGILQKTSLDPVEKKERKTLLTAHHVQWGCVHTRVLGTKALLGPEPPARCESQLHMPGAMDRALVKCTFDAMSREERPAVQSTGAGAGEGCPACADSVPAVCLGKLSAGSLLAAEELAPGTGLAANNSKGWRGGGSLRCCSPL